MTAHVHTWTERAGALPWARFCACSAEGELVSGVVVELSKPGAPVEYPVEPKKKPR